MTFGPPVEWLFDPYETTGFGATVEFLLDPTRNAGFGYSTEWLSDPKRNAGFGPSLEFSLTPLFDLIRTRHIETPTGIGDWEQRLAVTLDPINLKSVASTLICTVPNDSNFLLTALIVRCTGADGVSSEATVGLGKTTGTNEFLTPYVLTSLVGGAASIKPLAGLGALALAGESIFFNVTSGAVGNLQIASVELVGIPIRLP